MEILAAENKAYSIVSQIPMLPDLTFCNQLSENIHEFTHTHLFPQIPHYLDYIYSMYFVRTGGAPAEFLALMQKNDVNINIPSPNINKSAISYAKKHSIKEKRGKPLSDRDIVRWFGLAPSTNN